MINSRCLFAVGMTGRHKQCARRYLFSDVCDSFHAHQVIADRADVGADVRPQREYCTRFCPPPMSHQRRVLHF